MTKPKTDKETITRPGRTKPRPDQRRTEMSLNQDELNESADRLEEIIKEIKELLGEAAELVQDTETECRAEAYWMAQIEVALDNDHGYLASGSVTMQDSADELREEAKESEDSGTTEGFYEPERKAERRACGDGAQ